MRGASGITWDTPPEESKDEPQHPQYFHGTRAAAEVLEAMREAPA